MVPLRKFSRILPRSLFLIINKIFRKSWLGFAKIIYEQSYDSVFHDNLKSVQYNACVAITGAIGGTSTGKLCQEPGLEYLKSRHRIKKLCHFYDVFNGKSPSCFI